MNSRKVAGALMAGGTALTVGAWGLDLITCPGEVESTGGEVKIIQCDENPQEDNWLNRPGTPEQKLMYGGAIMIAVGGLTLLINKNHLARYEQEDEELPIPDDLAQAIKDLYPSRDITPEDTQALFDRIAQERPQQPEV